MKIEVKKKKTVSRQVGAEKNESEPLLVKVTSKKRKEIESTINHNHQSKLPTISHNPKDPKDLNPNNQAKKEKEKPKQKSIDIKAADSPVKSKKKLKLESGIAALAQTSDDTLETSK